MTENKQSTIQLDATQESHRALLDTLIRRVTAADGIAPFSDQGIVDWKLGTASLIAIPDGKIPPSIAGAALLSGSDTGGSTELELSIDPDARGTGLGSYLLDTALGAVPDSASGEILVWAHGNSPAAQRLARSRGFSAIRTLLQLSASVRDATNESDGEPYPGIRHFETGRDEEEWVALNAIVFADHPEQGKLTVEDVLVREEEPWFNEADFLLLTDEHGTILGYNWLKIAADASAGEVYAIGVSPDAAGRGLGRQLLLAGFDRLRRRGIETVSLYVEGNNGPALGLYRSSGFATANTSVHYLRSSDDAKIEG